MSTDKSTFIDQHLVRYEDLNPCTTAFIDTRTPGSKEKENFTIIGPGVSENPDQHVHITRAHGFNIGGARQPPGCINSQHSHDTAEVFVVHTGTWSFNTGEHGSDGKVILQPGDTISIPTRCFRGFENVGDDTGYLFAILGGDDPGKVTWAPYVFEQASEYGLVLLENGALVDTSIGEILPEGISPMPPTTQNMIEQLQVLNSNDLEACVARHTDITSLESNENLGTGTRESLILGTGAPTSTDGQQVSVQPLLHWAHGFQLTHLQISANTSTNRYAQTQEEVLLIQSGSAILEISGQNIPLSPGDVFTSPINEPHRIHNPSANLCELYVVHRGEQPSYSLLDS